MKKTIRPVCITFAILLLASVFANVYLMIQNGKLHAQIEEMAPPSLRNIVTYFNEIASYLYRLPSEDSIVYADSIRDLPADHSFASSEISYQSPEIEALISSCDVSYFSVQDNLGVRLAFTCETDTDAQNLLQLITFTPESIEVNLTDIDDFGFGYVVREFDLSVPAYRDTEN